MQGVSLDIYKSIFYDWPVKHDHTNTSVFPLMKILTYLQWLNTVSLFKLTLTTCPCLHITHKIDCFPGLKELTLTANNDISAEGWTHLFTAISACSSLRTLNIDYNNIGDYGVGCLAVVLASNHSLQLVDLEGCGITDFGGKVSWSRKVESILLSYLK